MNFLITRTFRISVNISKSIPSESLWFNYIKDEKTCHFLMIIMMMMSAFYSRTTYKTYVIIVLGDR